MTWPPEPEYWPTNNWRTAPAEAHGMDPGLLASLAEYARESVPPITSVAIVRRGYLVFEYYAAGLGPSSYHHVHSITKSVVSALVGVALREGYLQRIEQYLLEFLPEYDRPDLDPRKRAITLRHLLSMTSGFAPGTSDSILDT